MKASILGIGAILPNEGENNIRDFVLTNYPVAPKTYLDRASALALGTAGLALQNANLTGPFDEEFGLVTATRFGCVETMRVFENTISEKGVKSASPLLFSHSYFNSPAALIAIEWGLRGYHAPLVGEDSGIEALELAKCVIELGYAQRMLVGVFDALSTGRNFAEEENGIEGAVFFVLEASEVESDWEEARTLIAKISAV
jgi:3-oxoacyl-(acyl-carrier-protein) synthase